MEPVPGVPASDGLTFAILATTAGTTIAAGIIFGLIQLLKSSFPGLGERVSGATQAFTLSAVLYIVVAFALQPPSLDGYLVIFVSWLGCALSAVGIHATGTRAVVAAGVTALSRPGIAAKALSRVEPEVLAAATGASLGAQQSVTVETTVSTETSKASEAAVDAAIAAAEEGDTN